MIRTCVSVLISAFVISGTFVLAQETESLTLFSTEDYRQDREHWTEPAYFRHNTARELTDMQVDVRFGQAGSGVDNYEIRSPYEYKTSWEHYQALLHEADGGTQHTLATLPDWDGYWSSGGRTWLDSRDIQASTIAAALTPQYREYYVQQVKAEAEGRHWWPASFCLPDGFIRSLWRGDGREFVIRPHQVWFISPILVETQIRRIYTGGAQHANDEIQFPQWQGESIGFWDGDELIVHTNQIRSWNATHSIFEWSDQLTAVERYRRVGDRIEGEATLYDPVAFEYPLYAQFSFLLRPDPGIRPTYDTCTDTNGPSSNVFVRPDGIVDERSPGDPGYWDPTDPRPWASHYALGE